MRKIHGLLIFLGTFLIVMIVLTPTHSLTSSDLNLVEKHEIDFKNYYELFSAAFDGENVYIVNLTENGYFTIVKLRPDWSILSTCPLDLSENEYYHHSAFIETDGETVYLLLENTTDWWHLYRFYLGNTSLVKLTEFSGENLTGYVNSIDLQGNKLYILTTEYSGYGSTSSINLLMSNVTQHIYELDLKTYTIKEVLTIRSDEQKFASSAFTFTYLRNEFVFGTYTMGLYTQDGVLLRNLTEQGDVPPLQVPEGYNVSYSETYINFIDSNPDSDKLLVGVMRFAGFESGESTKDIYKLYILIYSLEPESTTVPSGEPNVTEPVTASSVAISTASAVVVTASVGAVATSAGAAGASTAGAGSAAGATTASVGSVASAGAAEGAFDADKLFGRYGKYGARLGKYALKLFKRKKKKDEEERFEKPSLLKFMVYIAVISGVVTGVFMLLKQVILSDLFLAASTLVTGIGFAFGGFGLLTGYLFIMGIKTGILPKATKFVMLSLIASIVGGVYGIVTSGLKLTGVFGFLILGLGVILLLIAVAFAYAAYMMTLNIYGSEV